MKLNPNPIFRKFGNSATVLSKYTGFSVESFESAPTHWEKKEMYIKKKGIKTFQHYYVDDLFLFV